MLVVCLLNLVPYLQVIPANPRVHPRFREEGASRNPGILRSSGFPLSRE